MMRAQTPFSGGYTVQVDTAWADAAPRWRKLMASCDVTPFQGFDWLEAWYQHIAPAVLAKPRLVTVSDATTGGLVMLLPLASVDGRHGSVLQFADEELSDFNGPLLGPVRVPQGCEPKVWDAIIKALPGHAIASLRKMPSEIQGRTNPLVAITGAQMSSVGSNALQLSGSFESYNASIDRRVRMELERCWRVLHREAAVTFEQVLDEATGLELLDIMDCQQRDRLTETGSVFTLDEPAQKAFYRHRLGERLKDGSVLLTAIRVNNVVIAAQYAIANARTVVVLRISNAGKNWSRVSPGRLVVHKSIECFYKLGFTVCDLSIGDYDYKRRFGVVRTPLVDLVAALSWRGQVTASRHWAVGRLRAHPEIDARVRALVRRLKASRVTSPN